MDGRNKGRVDFLLAVDDLSGGQGFGEGFAADFVDVHHAIDDRFIVWREDLDAACPIDFDGVVAGGIVAGGDHDAATGICVADGEGKFRRAAVAVEEEDLEAGGGHDFGAELGEVRELWRVS